jgi:hypothetical protein
MEDEINKQKGKDKNIIGVHVCTLGILDLLHLSPNYY